MMSELFAQDGGGLSPLVQQQMAQAEQMAQRRPGMQPTRRAMGGRPMPGTGMGAPIGQARTGEGAAMFNAVSGAGAYTDPRGGGNNAGGGRIGGNLGLGGGLDASMWNMGLPGGSLTGV
jgi:hypothetical protein